MKTLALQMIASMELELQTLEEKWDKLDSQARLEDQRKLVEKMVAIRNEIDNMKELIKILES